MPLPLAALAAPLKAGISMTAPAAAAGGAAAGGGGFMSSMLPMLGAAGGMAGNSLLKGKDGMMEEDPFLSALRGGMGGMMNPFSQMMRQQGQQRQQGAGGGQFDQWMNWAPVSGTSSPPVNFGPMAGYVPLPGQQRQGM